MQAIKAAAASVRVTVAREEQQRQQAEAQAAAAGGEGATGALGGPEGEGVPGLLNGNAGAPISYSGGVDGEGEDLVEVGNLTLPPGQQLLGAAGMGMGPGMGGAWGTHGMLGTAGGEGAGPVPFSEVQRLQHLNASLAANASGGLDLGAALSHLQPTQMGHSGQAGSGVAHTPSQRAFTPLAGDGMHSGYTAVGSSNARLDALRPTALVLAPACTNAGQQYHLAVQQQQQEHALQLQRQRRRSARDQQKLQELNVRLAAVRQIRRRRRARAVPPPEEVQALLCNAVGLLAAVSLSGAGSRAVCEAAGGGLLRHVVALLDVPWVGGGGAVDLGQVPEPAVAAVSGSGLELRCGWGRETELVVPHLGARGARA